MKNIVFFWKKEQKLTLNWHLSNPPVLSLRPVLTMTGTKFLDRVFQGAIHRMNGR
jgi:hypothetical protein